jgi:catechol 2,3-dioxygenase-like lactoylglutathione lyase family enzyme
MKIKSLLCACLLAFLSQPVAAGNNSLNEPAVVPDPLMAGRISNIIGVNHVGMTVRNIDRSLQFYEQSVGMTLVRRMSSAVNSGMPDLGNEKADTGKAAIIRGANSFLRLMEFDHSLPAHKGGVLPAQGPGITHICFQAPKAKPIDGKFIESGGSWVSSTGAMVDMRGVGFMYGYLRDPDGIMVEIEHDPEPKFNGDIWMAHVAIATPDLTKTLAFYEKVLGFAHFRRGDNRSAPTYGQVVGIEGAVLHGAWFRLAHNYNLEFWQFSNPKTPVRGAPASINQLGYNLIALETIDIEADYARIKAEGVALDTEIVETADGRAFYLRDPDGNLITLTEIEEGSDLSLRAPWSPDKRL